MISYDALPFMEAISDAQIWDGKDLVDGIPRPGLTFEAIQERYLLASKDPNFDLRAFAVQNLEIRDVGSGKGYVVADSLIHHSYELLRSNICEEKKSQGTLIGLPGKYIKACPGRFDFEQYENDTGENIQGLAVDLADLANPEHITLHSRERYDLIESMIDNQVFLQKNNKEGCIPTANRTYYLRPQITHVASNVLALADLWQKQREVANEDILTVEHPLIKYRGFMLKEWMYWNGGLRHLDRGGRIACAGVVRLDDRGTMGNFYRDGAKGPRLEVRSKDLATLKEARQFDPSLDAEFLFQALRASAASGWDHSSRWLSDYYNLRTMRTQHIVPVDLTAKLRELEDALRQSYELSALVCPSEDKYDLAIASRFQGRVIARDAMIERKHYDPETGYYYDYDYSANSGEGARTKVISTAGLFPLMVGAMPLDRAARIEEVVREELLKDGGIQVTNIKTPEQWDADIGWAGQTISALRACEQGGLAKLGFDISDRWITSATNALGRLGSLPENLNVTASGLRPRGDRGEYPEQQNFSWTAASVLYATAARAKFAKKIEFPAAADINQRDTIVLSP